MVTCSGTTGEAVRLRDDEDVAVAQLVEGLVEDGPAPLLRAARNLTVSGSERSSPLLGVGRADASRTTANGCALWPG
jgi:hypothetical protein